MAVKPQRNPSSRSSKATASAKSPPVTDKQARIRTETQAAKSLVAKAAIAKPHVALVLQGGGALGAYQAGVYQALHEHNLTPDWVVGTSIGAINAAIIAGNPRETRLARLREFWDRVGQADAIDMSKVPDISRQLNIWLATMETYTRGVPGFFAPRAANPFALGMHVTPEDASFYDTAGLAGTLNELIDFDYLNASGGMRLTVSAMKVICGSLVNFDSRRRRIGVEHIMASGALPPGFPAVRVDGDLYWDGGMYSNTPLETVLEDEPRRDTICVMVDLWLADGAEPTSLEEVQTRQKDVTFASRSQAHIDSYLRTSKLRSAARALYARLPPELQDSHDLKDLKALGKATTIHVVRLQYTGRDWNMASKDINFSRGSIGWRWEQGYNDALRALEGCKESLFEPDDSGIVIHDFRPAADIVSCA
ncbi:patatin-like phospholipase family protein [Oxalobacteraceae bacterium CAVE-383]|nr:patatin-like phospholipase family protein [Oxalobacteraceae bacterium CAVE-383]